MNVFFKCLLFILVCAGTDILLNPSDNIWISLAIFIIVDFIFDLVNIRTQTITVSATAIQVTKFGFKRHIIKAADGKIFMNHNYFPYKYNAKKLQQKIKIGKTYKIKSVGILLTNTRNILSATEIKQSKPRKHK